MFAYCLNRPTSFSDYGGSSAQRCTISINDTGSLPVIISQIANTAAEQTKGVINGQDLLPYAYEFCGLGTYAHNGCGPIAIYNMMQLVGKPQSLKNISSELFWSNKMIAFGLLGVNPWGMDDYFTTHGVEYIGSFSADLLTANISEGSIIVFTVMYSGGWHTMTTRYTNNEYVVFNRYDNVSSHRSYSSLSDVYAEGRFVYGYRIYS